MTQVKNIFPIVNYIRELQSAIAAGMLHGDTSALTPENRGYLRALDKLEAYCLGLIEGYEKGEESEGPPW